MVYNSAFFKYINLKGKPREYVPHVGKVVDVCGFGCKQEHGSGPEAEGVRKMVGHGGFWQVDVAGFEGVEEPEEEKGAAAEVRAEGEGAEVGFEGDDRVRQGFEDDGERARPDADFEAGFGEEVVVFEVRDDEGVVQGRACVAVLIFGFDADVIRDVQADVDLRVRGQWKGCRQGQRQDKERGCDGGFLWDSLFDFVLFHTRYPRF